MAERGESKSWQDILGWVALVAIIGLAIWFRFNELGLKPMHHDEGVNAQFTVSLVEKFRYRYNPYNFHGPLLYFLTYPVVLITGVTDLGMRFMPAVFGTLAVPGMLLFRRRLGWLGVLVPALLIAIAPVEVYFSKTAIHEIYNFTFNLLMVGGFWLWWRTGKRWGLYLGAASLACLFATKETTIITVAAVAPSLIAAWLLAKPAPRFVGGAAIPPRLLTIAPGFWSRRVRSEAGLADDADAEVWPPESAPRSVHAAWERLEGALARVKEAAAAAVEAQKAAMAQAEAAALPSPPPLPWSVKAEVRPPQPTGSGRHWAVRGALMVYALIFAGVVGAGVGVVQTKFGLELPDWAKFAGAGGAAGLGLLITLILPSAAVWWMRSLALPFTFIKAAWCHDRRASRIALGIFLTLMILLFSSFFTHLDGLWKFFEAFIGWGKTGVEGKGHEKVWYYWVEQLLIPYYRPVLFVALPAMVIGSIKRDALSIFSLGWFVLALAAYSAIPYKTPWCVLSFSGPLFIAVGIAVKALVDVSERLSAPSLRLAAVGIPLLAAVYPVALYGQQSVKINLEEYDVDYHAFIYVQNLREYFDFTSDVAGIMYTAQKTLDRDPKIWMVKTRNPLRYYVDGIGDSTGSPTWNDENKKKAQAAELIMANRSSAKGIEKLMKGKGYVHRWYHERPGQKYDVFIKQSLWDDYLKLAKAGEVAPPTEPAPKRHFSDVRSKEYRDADRAKKKAKQKK